MPGAVPSTTYSLPHAQRARLVRSTRKLKSVLGETSLLVDIIPSSTSVSEPDSTLSAVASSAKSSRRSSRPVLIVRLPGAASIIPGTNSPLTPTSGISLNSPALGMAAEEDTARRRKMAAKLSRTLGENIPPELVLPSMAGSAVSRRASSVTMSEICFGAPSRRASSTHISVTSA
ncbi:hypothetical protein B0H19DRAFT_1381060 [Mycena capillaripes]|nr:hypothetical protein B0H19DRAFT_1381060 [Mycena capillaripes]